MSSLHRLATAARRLVTTTRLVDAPEDELADAAASIETVLERLDGHRHEGPRMQRALKNGDWVPSDTLPGDAPTTAHDLFPYSPVVGALNPVSPAAQIWLEDKEEEWAVRGTVTFPAQFNGPPEGVHGGMISALHDELLGYTGVVLGVGGFTRVLTINYLALTPLDTQLDLRGRVREIDGRKAWIEGELRHGDTVLNTSEGLFVRPKEYPVSPG